MLRDLPPPRMSQSLRTRGQHFAPEEVPPSESDQNYEPVTPAAEGTETEDWLIDFSEVVLTPTLSYPLPSSSLFLEST